MQWKSTIWMQRLRATTALAGALAALLPASSYALPVGGQVSAGQAGIASSGNQVTVSQATSRAVIDWGSFDIDSGESVRFNQPSSSAIALNRIHDASPSQINGQLTANGQVWLVNPNGVMFGKQAQVNVAGLLATSSDIDSGRFMGGDYRFDIPGSPDATIGNAGAITVSGGGLAALVGPNVSNSGVIQAKLGKVQLASGDTFSLDLNGDGLLSLQASPAITRQLVENSGTISDEGGQVLLTAAAAQNTINSLINMDGVIQANSVGEREGHVVLYAEGSNAVANNVEMDKSQRQGDSTVLVSGRISARGSSAGEKGGTVEVLGDHVGILSGATIDASGSAGGGTIRVGGDYHGGGTTPTARATIVQSGSLLLGNAIGSGEGGKVTVWADERAWFAGNIEARGGQAGGDGGFVETSGKQFLSATGIVDAKSPWGKAGVWLLDPNSITIQAAGGDTNVAGSPNFTTTDDSAIVTTGSIQAALNAGTSVSITTGSAGANSEAGDITVADTITKSAGTDATLTLSAYRNITVNAAISSSSNKLNLLLRADNADNSSGYIKIAAALTSNAGNITLGGGSGAISAGSGYAVGNAGQKYGVYVTNTVNAGGGNVIINGKGNNAATNNNYGVFVGGGTVQTSGSGTMSVNGIGRGTGNSRFSDGVEVDLGGVISTVDGDLAITAAGGGAGTGTDNYGVGLLGANSTIKTTGAGNIAITGTGGDPAGSGTYNFGVLVNTANGIQTTGSGNITVTGTGGNSSGGSNSGVYVADGSINNSGTGTITVSGTGGGGSVGGDLGVYINTGGAITGNGGAMTITGTGSNAAGGDNYGVNVSGGIISNSGTGTLTITATGRGNADSGDGYGLQVTSGGVISTADGDLAISATGGGAGTGHHNYGVWVNDVGSTIQTTGSGNISVTGIGGNAGGSGDTNYGVYVDTVNGIRATGTGGITVAGTGGNSSGWSNYGVYVDGGSITNSGAGTLTLSGTGRGNTNSGDDEGVVVFNGGILSTVDGDLTITGTGGGAGTGSYNHGVFAGGSIAAGAGNIVIAGTGGNGTGGDNYGVIVDSANGIRATGSGSITVSGISGEGIDGYGVWVDFGGSSITGSGGAMAITGAGGTSSDDSNYGVLVSGGSITNSGAGTLTVSGTGGGTVNSGDDVGVFVHTGGILSTVNGDLTVTGSGGGAGTGTNNYGVYVTGFIGANSAINTTGAGKLSVTGTRGGGDAATNYGLKVAIANGLRTAGTGQITVSADTISLAEANDLNSAAALTIHPYTAATTVGIGTGAGTLSITDAYLGFLTWGGSSFLTIGDTANTGTMEINSAFSFAKPLRFLTSAGHDITISGQLTDSVAGGGATNAAVVLASGRNFINSFGATAFNLTGANSPRWLIYSTSPVDNTLDGLALPTEVYNKTYAGYPPGAVAEAGSVMFYSVPGLLTFAADDKSKLYGSANPALTYSFSCSSGCLENNAVTGSPSIITAATNGSNVGTYSIASAMGTLALTGPYAGYVFSFVDGTLTINKAHLTVTADDKSKTYGAADPALTYQYSGLVNGDLRGAFIGALSRDPGEAAGAYAINQGTLAATGNYTIGTYNLADLTINPPGGGGGGGNNAIDLPDSYVHESAGLEAPVSSGLKPAPPGLLTFDSSDCSSPAQRLNPICARAK